MSGERKRATFRIDLRQCSHFGEAIKAARERGGWTHMRMSKVTGIPIEAIVEYEKDSRCISIENALKFKDILNASAEDLSWRAEEDGKYARGDYH
jgi:DNA-binding XRE family transcriptional regulator